MECTRFIMEDDIVPRLPMPWIIAGYHHVGKGIHLDEECSLDMGFFSRLFCCSRNALSDVDDMEKPYNNFNFKNVKSRNYFEHVKQSKGILFKSSCFYRGWVDSLITGCPTVINPKNDEQRVSFRGQVDGFNSGIKGLILLSMESRLIHIKV